MSGGTVGTNLMIIINANANVNVEYNGAAEGYT
jgi:hypothetical protein